MTTTGRARVTWRDRALWLAYAIGFTYTPVSYLGAMWPGGPGAVIAILIGTAATLYAVKYLRWPDSGGPSRDAAGSSDDVANPAAEP